MGSEAGGDNLHYYYTSNAFFFEFINLKFNKNRNEKDMFLFEPFLKTKEGAHYESIFIYP